MDSPCVLFLAEELRMGGAETYFYELENSLLEGIDFYSMAVQGARSVSLRRPERCRAYSFHPLDRVRKIGLFAREISADVIHCNSLQLAFCASVSRKIYGLPCRIVYTKHNLTRLERISTRMFTGFVNKCIDRIVAICPHEASALADAGVRIEKITVINNGVDLERFRFAPHFSDGTIHCQSSLEVGILARLAPEKRHGRFLQIAKSILDAWPHTHFTIAGDGPERASIVEKIEQYGLTGCVSMLGAVDPVEYLKSIDCLMLVSDREVLPMSLIEGMATGLVVIARDVGGVEDIVKPEFSYLIQSDDDHDYVAAIEASLSRDTFGKLQDARRYVESRFSLERSLLLHRQLYFELSSSL